MIDETKKKQIINLFLEKEILISPDIIDIISKENFNVENIRDKIESSDFLHLSKEINNILDNNNNTNKNYNNNSNNVKVLFSYDKEQNKVGLQNFVSLFNARYKFMEKLLHNRLELDNIMSINRIISKKDKENVSFIGMVSAKRHTKNQHLMLEIEDPTGKINVLVNKSNNELYPIAQDIILDEIIGISGTNSENIIFANNIIWPDIPSRNLKKSEDDIYAIFLSDLHVGSNNFMEKELLKFISWLNMEVGNDEQKEMASKIKYIFIIGDLVDGVGIYPGQESELIISDIYEQYNECARLLSKIPKHISIIICPGNHDAMRIAEPQPQLCKDFASALWELPNVIMVSNPGIVNIHKSENFSGFNVLMYHGYSFDHYIANVDSIRNNGGYNNPELIMKFLLQRRHLAPTHSSTLYVPDPEKDNLVIEKIPDFFATGHIHKSSVSNYKNITMICGSCWQSTTPFQVKVGHVPEPCRVPVVNLNTRNVKIIKFGD